MSDGGEHQRDGRLIGGRYRLVERIGSGGMGTVWRAHDELVDREVAVKQPRLPGAPEDEVHQRAAHRLHREARAAARVEHPCAVTIHDVVVEDGLPWIVMELVRGESLHERLRRGALPVAEAARVGHAVLGALRAAHAVGIVHRDVKPANVLLGRHGRVVLTDFGIAHVQGEESLTVSGEFVGSLEFVAPERMSGRIAGPPSDLWSLGVLLHAAVEGGSPFRRTTVESTLAAILGDDLPEPQQAGPLGPLIVRLLAKAPEERPDPAEATATLDAVAEGRPVPVAEGKSIPVAEGRSTAGADAGRAEAEADGGRTMPEADVGEAESEPGAESETGVQEPGSEPGPSSTEPAVPPPPRGRRLALRHPVAYGLVGALLAGVLWFGVSVFGGQDDDTSAAELGPMVSDAGSVGPSTGSTPAEQDGWTVHREPELDASLALPSDYEEQAREGDLPRIVVYGYGPVSVRLTQWDKAPRDAMGQAQEAHTTWSLYDPDASTQYTRTSFQGGEAVIADTTYTSEGSSTRVMELMILTADSRMYELRVDMPKGTPDERRGTSVFKGARDRLELGRVG
ncbi:protein kinase [Streptomyces sp. NPDC088387]|uniref:serine/threonine-protein kinase n=1 Tax=Streptomyces sp. NPDC088387 TaxID=3365859 RepID=UPI00382756DF